MGLFNKIANIFYDEVEEDDTPKEEKKEEKVVKKEIEKPRIEEIHFEKTIEKEEIETPKEEKAFEKPFFKSETKEAKTFKFPIIDEEEEEVKVTPEINRTRSSIYDIEKREEPKETRRESKYESFGFNRKEERKVESPRKEEVRTFRPSPVISPVYGILDKNYTKEEIIARQENIRTRDEDVDYDSIRRKAYGTLEDELENTLSKITSAKKEVEKTIEEMDSFDEDGNNKSIEELLSEIETNKNMSIGEIEEKYKDEIEEEEEKQEVEEEPETEEYEEAKVAVEEEKEEPKEEEEEESFDKTLEHDLFNLIDSMYEEKERE